MEWGCRFREGLRLRYIDAAHEAEGREEVTIIKCVVWIGVEISLA